MPSRSSLRNSETPSAIESRFPRAILSASGCSDGSLIRCGSSWTCGAGTVSLLEALYGERDVMPAKPEAVAQHRANRTRHRGVRRVVQIELGIGSLVVDRGRNDAIANRECADDEFDRAGGAEHVAGHRLGRAHVDLRRQLTEDR